MTRLLRSLTSQIAILSRHHPDDPRLPRPRAELKAWAEAETAKFPPPTAGQVAEWAPTARVLDGWRDQGIPRPAQAQRPVAAQR